jgi:hypothetical protein
LQAALIAVLQVVMPDIRRITYDEVEMGRRLRVCEVGRLNHKTRVFPKVRCRLPVVRVEFETESPGDAVGGENLAERGLERAGPNAGVQKVHFFGARNKRSGVF